MRIENGTRRRARVYGLALVLLILLAPATAITQPSADELLLAAENSVFPNSFRADVTLATREGGETISEMQLRISYRHETGSYMEIVAPARSRGLRFLQVEDSLWMYNPRAGGGRAIRLSPRASFQGSTFSNRDLSDPEFADDYSVELDGSETIEHPDLGSVECWVLNATAKNEQVAYARIRSWVSKGSRTLLRSHYFAKSGLLFKTARFRDIRELAGARRPTTVEMRSRQQSDRVSVMTITSMEAVDDLPDRLFTRRYLTR
jgi:hypothetical protein